jgi:tRNA/rRNA methyltransferase
LRLGDLLSVTVVGAEYPVNLGYTARLMKNFGVGRLYLVSPKCDMRAASVYASHGSDVLERAEVVTLAKVRRTHDLLLGTTAIRARRGANVSRTTVRPDEAVARMMVAERTSMVFGRDTTGLTNEELALCDLVTTVETKTDYKTLNVSHSVAILLYLASTAQAAGSTTGTPAASRASRERREAFSRYAYRLAIASGMQKHRAERMVQVARRVALKSDVNSRELGLLVSLMRKAEFAIKRAEARPVPGRTPSS